MRHLPDILDPLRILRAGITQITAGLPLSFYSAGYQASVMDQVYPASSLLHYDLASFLRSVRLSDVILLLASCFILSRRGKGEEPAGRPVLSELAVLGLSFALLPAVTVAMSQRYQGQLVAGLGYLPVYIQYFGIVMLLLCLTLRLKPCAGSRALCLSAFALIFLLNLQNNRAVTQIMNRSFYDPRNAGEAALAGGILDFLPEDAVLISVNERTYLWEADWNNRGLYSEFYGNYSRRLPETVGDTGLLRGMGTENEDGLLTLSPENIWVIFYGGSTERGFAKLGHLTSAELDPRSGKLRSAETDEVLWFVSGDFPERATVQYTGSDGSFRRIAAEERSRVRLSDAGILYALPKEEEILFDSLTLTEK